jgi:hypothetical protein
MILIDDYCDETISGNYFTADDGDTQYYDNGRHACTVSLKRLPQHCHQRLRQCARVDHARGRSPGRSQERRAVLGLVRRGAAIFEPTNRTDEQIGGRACWWVLWVTGVAAAARTWVV